MRMCAALVLLLFSTIASAQTAALKAVPPPSDVAAPPADAKKTASGLVSKIVAPGDGKDRPTPVDFVTINYTGWTTDGKMFDSSIVRGATATFRVNGVIPGFSEGIQLMVPGEKRRLWVPEALAYKGQPGKPAGMLVFDVDLIEMPNRAPPDVKAAPNDAVRTASGLSYIVLKEGVGGRHPRGNGAVTVHYTGWTTDGKMFDSSVVRGQPATFPLDSVIPGWTEGMQLMVEGQKMRFWIPENLAYQGKSSPYGMLVFDVELIKIQ